MTQQDYWAWWLPSLRQGRLLPAQQGFAEPLLQNSFHQLSKGLLSRSYYDSAEGSESNSLTICTQQGELSTGVTVLHKLCKDLLSPPWNLCTTTRLSRRTESDSHSTWHRDSVEESSWVWLSTNNTGAQQKDAAEAGSLLTVQGLSRRMQLSLAPHTQHRDSAEGWSWVWLRTVDTTRTPGPQDSM